MKTNDLLAALDREELLLAQENWHAAAAIVRAAAERLRVLAQRLREAEMSIEE